MAKSMKIIQRQVSWFSWGLGSKNRRCPVVPQLRTMHLAQSSSGEDIHRPCHYLEKLMAVARLSKVQWIDVGNSTGKHGSS